MPASRLNSAGSASGHKGGAAGFDAFRSKLRSNLQGVKKQTKSAATNGDTDSEGPAAFNSAKLVGSAVHHYTEEVRRLELCPGFIWGKIARRKSDTVRQTILGHKNDQKFTFNISLIIT